jgi:hypothetical protein
MPNQTVTRCIETDKSPDLILKILHEPRNITHWAPVFADAIEHLESTRYRVTKDQEKFLVDVLIDEPARCVDYLREMPNGIRAGAYIRVTPRPKGGSSVTMTVPVGPTSTEEQVAEVVVSELDALVRMA